MFGLFNNECFLTSAHQFPFKDGPSPSPARLITSQGQNLMSYMSLCSKCACVRAKLLQSCPTLCDPIDCSLPGSASLLYPRDCSQQWTWFSQWERTQQTFKWMTEKHQHNENKEHPPPLLTALLNCAPSYGGIDHLTTQAPCLPSPDGDLSIE